MREENNIEKSINKKFNDFQLAMPPDLWSKIEANLDGEKKKRKAILFWKLFGGSICLIGLCIGLIAWKTSNLPGNIPTANAKQDATRFKNRVAQTDKVSNKDAKAISKTVDKKSTQSEEIKQVASHDNKQQEFKKQANLDVKNNSAFVSKKSSGGNSQKLQNRSIALKNQIGGKNTATDNRIIYPKNLANDQTAMQSPETKKEANEPTNPIRVDLLSFRKLNLLDIYLEQMTPKFNGIDHKSKPVNGQWSISTSVSVSDNYRKLDIPNQPALRTHRNQNEKQFFSLAYQIQAEYSFRNVMVGVGYGFAKKGELYNFNLNGVTHSSKNFYSYNQFQISLAKRFALKNNFLLVPGFRTSFNFLKHAHASWVDPTTFKPITHSSGAISPFRKQVVSGELYAELITSYKHFEYFLTPKFNMMFKSIYREEVAIKQYPFAFELGFGLRYKL
jgi:hypothetical protein